MNTSTEHDTLCTLRVQRAIAAAALCLLSANGAFASEWKLTLTPYAWATDVGAEIAIADREVVDETIAFEDLLEDLDTVAQVRFEAQRGVHGVMFDLFDVTLSDEGDRVALPSGRGDVVVDSQIGMTIFDLGGIWDPNGDQRGFSLFYGTRILDQREEIDADFELGTTTESRNYASDETLVDAMVGVRYVKRFTKRWSYQMQAEVSTGGTEMTWSAGPSITYAFGDTGRYSLTAGYRRMEIDFESAYTLDAEMELSGFLMGLRMGF